MKQSLDNYPNDIGIAQLFVERFVVQLRPNFGTDDGIFCMAATVQANQHNVRRNTESKERPLKLLTIY